MPTPAAEPTVYTAAVLQGMSFPEPKWAVPTLLPVGLALLAGKPKIGKSWMALGLSLAIGYGGAALGKIKVEPGEVLYLALEDRWQRLQSRLQKLAPNGKWPVTCHLSPDWPRSDKGGLTKLAEWLGQHPSCRFVIVDTLPRFRRRVPGGAKNQFDEDYITGESLKAVADHFNLCLLVLCHLRKLDADDPFDTISGTIGLSAAADTNLVLMRARGEGEATLWITGRDVDEGKLALRWDAQLATWALVGSAEDYARTKERREVIRVLVESGQALSAKDIAVALKRRPENVRQQLWQMCQAGEIQSVGDGRYMANSQKHSTITHGNNANNASARVGSNLSPGRTVSPVSRNEQLPTNGQGKCIDCGCELAVGRVLRCGFCDDQQRTWLNEMAASLPPEEHGHEI